MGKLVIFRLAGADFKEGFTVTLQICEDNPENITHPFTTIMGKLPPAPFIDRHYQKWQENYRHLSKQVRLGSPPNQVTHISQSCQDYADNLHKNLSQWYQQSLAEISEQVSEMEVRSDRTDETIIPQSFHDLAAQIWQDLQAVSSPDEMFSLLAPLQDDIDGLAWLNDQYELAIASYEAKLKKISQILQSQIDELEQGKKVLSEQLLSWHQQGLLKTKAQGKERNVTFKSYPKLNLKVKLEELPPDYRSEKISYSANKKALKAANHNGLDISKWAEIDANLKVKFGFR